MPRALIFAFLFFAFGAAGAQAAGTDIGRPTIFGDGVACDARLLPWHSVWYGHFSGGIARLRRIRRRLSSTGTMTSSASLAARMSALAARRAPPLSSDQGRLDLPALALIRRKAMFDQIRNFVAELTGAPEARSFSPDDYRLAAVSLLVHLASADGDSPRPSNAGCATSSRRASASTTPRRRG